MIEALYYSSLNAQTLVCELCPNFCQIQEGATGICQNRINLNHKLFTLNYGQCASFHLDPIEKKPLYHFYPGASILSFGTYGCSFSCAFCQNHSISRIKTPEQEPNMNSQQMVNITLDHSSKLITYTYNEPYIWFEQVLECAKLAKANGLKNVLVTNGYFNPLPWKELAPYLDAMNIDLKGDASFYQRFCGGKIEAVLETITQAFSRNIHIELTMLIIPGENDEPQAFQKLVTQIAALSKSIPFHLSRYFPNYKLNLPPTPQATLESLRQIAAKKLDYVYLGNTADDCSTNCPSCHTTLVKRQSYTVKLAPGVQDGICPTCGYKLYGQWELQHEH